MAVVDLRRRLARDQSEYRAALKSDCSLLLITPAVNADFVDVGSIDFSVGDRFFDSHAGSAHSIPDEGVLLRPNQAVVVYTRETVCLPYNVFGLLSGKGTLIFNGVFISQGKIDPGFQDNLRIGVLNAGRQPLKLVPGMPICACTFFQMETHLDDPLSRHGREPAAQPRATLGESIWGFLVDNGKWIITTLIAVAAVVAALVGGK